MVKYLIKMQIGYFNTPKLVGTVYTEKFAQKIVDVKRKLYPYIFYYESEV